MMRASKGIAIVAMLALSACAADRYGPRESAGAIGGAVVGGLVGSRFGGGGGQLIATGIGTLVGAFLGSEAGRSLDRADRLHHREAAEQAQRNRIGERATWTNPATGHCGSVTPVRQGYDRGGRYCREYQQTIVVGGRTQSAHGNACLEADGSWRIIDGPVDWRTP